MEKRTISLPVAAFNRFKKLSAEKAAIDRKRKKIKAAWEKAGLIPEAIAANAGEYVIVNGAGDEIGKATVYHKDAFSIPAHYETRIS